MKTLLLISWLGLGGVSYFGYGFYVDILKKQDETVKVNDALQNANDKNNLLSSEVDALKVQLDEEKKIEATLQVTPTAPTPTSIVQTPTTSTSSTFVFPAIITTISGTTYQGCKLDRATPDGISFFHENGVAKVPYTDLDPTFAKEFGYNPDEAARYAKDESIKEAQSDLIRQQTTAQQKAMDSTAAALTVAAPVAVVPNVNQPSANQSKISSLRSQISNLLSQASAIDSQDVAAFNAPSNIYTNQNGQLEHHYNLQHNPQAGIDRDHAAALQAQISQLAGH